MSDMGSSDSVMVQQGERHAQVFVRLGRLNMLRLHLGSVAASTDWTLRMFTCVCCIVWLTGKSSHCLWAVVAGCRAVMEAAISSSLCHPNIVQVGVLLGCWFELAAVRHASDF